MESISLSLMFMTFFVSLVLFFITSVDADAIEAEVRNRPEIYSSGGPRTVRVTSYHPVLKENVAIARLMALER